MKTLPELIAAAHLNSVKHGFWGVWRPTGSIQETPMVCCIVCGNGVEEKGKEPDACVDCGAKDDPTQRDIPTKISLIHSELSEALEEFRLGDEKRGGKLDEVIYLTCAGERQKELFVDHFGDRLVGPYCRSAIKERAEDRGCRNSGENKHKPEGFVVELADAAIRLFDLTGWLGKAEVIERMIYDGEPMLNSPEKYIPGELSVQHNLAALLGRDLEHEQSGLPTIRIAGLLRSLDRLAHRVEGNLDEAIEIKMAFNATRPMKHGKSV